MNSSKVCCGVIVGAAAGAVLGILFAPDKGSVTRKNISNKGDYYVKSVKDNFNEFLDSVSGKFHKGMEYATKTVEEEIDNLKVS
jgi:gas vesicle protein